MFCVSFWVQKLIHNVSFWLISAYHKGAFKYYVSTFWGDGGLNKNADTADAWEGVSDQMLTLGTGGMEKVGL